MVTILLTLLTSTPERSVLQCRHLDSTRRTGLLCHQYLLCIVASTHFLCLYIESMVVLKGHYFDSRTHVTLGNTQVLVLFISHVSGMLCFFHCHECLLCQSSQKSYGRNGLLYCPVALFLSREFVFHSGALQVLYGLLQSCQTRWMVGTVDGLFHDFSVDCWVSDEVI